jgi:hypothetical protein
MGLDNRVHPAKIAAHYMEENIAVKPKLLNISGMNTPFDR